MLNFEQLFISITQKFFTLLIRLRWSFVLMAMLYAVYIYTGTLVLFISMIICIALIFIGYSKAVEIEEENEERIEIINELIKKVIEKFFSTIEMVIIGNSKEVKFISLIFLRFNKKNYRIIKLLFPIFLATTLVMSSKYEKYSIIIFLTLFIFLLSLYIKEQLLEYRISKGLFGTNYTEARELIDFIIKNSDNLDLTDSNGNLRRALLPEAKDAAEELIPGTLGEEALA